MENNCAGKHLFSAVQDINLPATYFLSGLCYAQISPVRGQELNASVQAAHPSAAAVIPMTSRPARKPAPILGARAPHAGAAVGRCEAVLKGSCQPVKNGIDGLCHLPVP